MYVMFLSLNVTCLWFFAVMQVGLSFLEAGAARLKNTTDIIIKKMIILCKCKTNYFVAMDFNFLRGRAHLLHK